MKNSKLTAIIQEMCAIIYFQQPLKKQDEWLKERIKDGLWDLELCEDEEYENGFVKEGEEE